jgi:gliding motility-associated-like protein
MTLKVSDHHNCKDELTQRFSVSEKLIVPKAFTPNGDNLNDFFVVQTNGRTTYKLQIFNMNGQLVFKSDSKSIIWDGNFTNGSKAAPGTYLYIIEPESGAGSKRISGFVMLLRQYDK